MIIVTLVFIFIFYFYSVSEGCKSQQCFDQAQKMISIMNPKIDPCEDFFEFSCGRWEDHNPIPLDTTKWKNNNKLALELKENIKEIMESNLEYYPDIVKLSQTFYKSCMDLPWETRNTEFEKLTNLKFKDFRGITNLTTYFIRITFSTDMSSPYVYDIINLVPLTNPYNYPIYTKSILDILWTFGYPNNPLGKEQIDAIIDFEDKLIKLRSSQPKIYEYKLKSLEELTNGSIDWKEFFKIKLYGNGGFDVLDKTIDWSKQLIRVYDPNFFVKVGEFLKNVDENLLVNVAKWRILYKNAPHIIDVVNDAYYFSLYYKYAIPEERWTICTDLIVEKFGIAILNPYIQNYFPISNKIKLEKMMKRIQYAFKTIIQNSKLVNEDIKKSWIETTSRIESLIAYPDWILNSTQLAHYYENLRLTNSSHFFLSLSEVDRWKNKKDCELFNTTFDKSILLREPFDMGAFHYFKMHNFIVVTAGFLKYPNYGMPLEVLHFGAIGFTLGHELTHTIIPNNNFSLANQTCLIEQYDQFIADPIEGLKINGTLTFKENYADNGGIQIAYKAYQDYIVNEREGVEEEKLPGLEHLNSKQIFFLAFTQRMCAAIRTGAMKDLLFENSHPPEKFRVKGLYNNFKEFSQAWNCPRPKNPCLIW